MWRVMNLDTFSKCSKTMFMMATYNLAKSGYQLNYSENVILYTNRVSGRLKLSIAVDHIFSVQHSSTY